MPPFGWCKHTINWSNAGLGTKPDSVVALELGVHREYVTFHRRRHKIQSFIGVALDQTGMPVRSAYEAMYDAFLHANNVPHVDQRRVPGSSYISDFLVGGVYIEIVGMPTHLKYGRKLKAKKDFYAQACLPVLFLQVEDIERLYRDCPTRVQFRTRFCSDCGKDAGRRFLKGRCKQCYMLYWRERRKQVAP